MCCSVGIRSNRVIAEHFKSLHHGASARPGQPGAGSRRDGSGGVVRCHRGARVLIGPGAVIARHIRHNRRRQPTDTNGAGLTIVGGVSFLAELSPRTFWTFLREWSSLRRTPRVVLEALSGVSEPPMIIRMTTTSRPQHRYDHRLRNLVQRTGDVTVATDLGVPRSTARGWLGAAPTVVVCLDVADLTEPELRQEVLKLRRRVQKLTALLRLALALLTNLRVSPHRRASAGRTRQVAHPARRGSGPRVPPVASGPAVPTCVAQSVPCLAPAAERVCAR
jgi:hypothetical protein